MRISTTWLNEWVKIELSAHQLAEQLTMIGLAVDSVEPAAPAFSNVVVAEIMHAEKHPNADKLQVCKVNIGKENNLQIVCGASNARKGIKVACAIVGAKLLNDFEIKKAKLRGVESEGMLCSLKELGLAESSEGIMELPQDAPVGKNFREYYQLNDEILEIDLTPNRGDCTSHRGIAREIAAMTQSIYREPEILSVKPKAKELFPIHISATEACPRYVGRIIKNIDAKKETPVWMKEKLRRCGLRSISPVVDVTNYILLELGQPLHAFDLDTLNEGIEVRFASQGEKLKLLDETEISLFKDTLIIADKKKPLAIAGVMGGLHSGVTEKTKNIFLESAFFAPKFIANKARQYGLQTDSSYRFERGVDYQLQIKAIERATQLLLEIVGGEPCPLSESVEENYLPSAKPIILHQEKITKLLGHEVSESEIENILNRLQFILKKENATSWIVHVPSHRFDIHIEEDLIEEIARIYGYDKIPARFYKTELHAAKSSNKEIEPKTIRELLKARDYHEVITYSFVDRETQLLFESTIEPKPLLNPMSKEMAVMRTNLWPGLVQTLQYNLNRQQQRIRLFEIGLRYQTIDKKLSQDRVVSGLVYGLSDAEQWGEPKRGVDFYDMKIDIETLLSLTHQRYQFLPAKHEALHPGQSAKIRVNQACIGYCGLLHPTISQKLKIKGPTYIFELLLSPLLSKILPVCEEVSKFPSIRRDIALLVDQSITSDQIASIIRRETRDLLVGLCVFDLFLSKDIEKNKKSIAYGLTLQHKSSTLIDSEINEIMTRVIQSLEQELSAQLRS